MDALLEIYQGRRRTQGANSQLGKGEFPPQKTSPKETEMQSRNRKMGSVNCAFHGMRQ